MKNKFELIIFDWDGTLVNSVDWIVSCMQKAALQCDIPVPDTAAVKNIIGLSIEKALENLFPGMDKKNQEHLITCYSHYFFSRQTGKEDLFDGVGDMLEHFKSEGYLLAVATGKKSTGLAKAMQGTGLEVFFDATRGADQTASKPDPLMINEIVNELQVSKDKVVMIGDSTHDLEMARNADVSAVGVCCGAHSRDRLEHYRPIACLQKTTELRELLV